VAQSGRLIVFLLFATLAFSQANTGELRLSVTDSSDLPVQAEVEVSSKADAYAHTADTDGEGRFTAKRLPFGFYAVTVRRTGFMTATQTVEIRSAIPKELKLRLGFEPVKTTVDVNDNQLLIDPASITTANHIGSAALQNRLTPMPGRSLSELVNQQPGWMLEANGVLHPRGEEYQTQYVLDGIPITDNRSAAFAPDFDANNVQSMSVLTAGFPAEYGRKMGGVVEVETQRDTRQGLHGKFVASGGSFATLNGYGEAQYGSNKDTLTLSAAGSFTNRFLDPPVLQNFTNHGSAESFMAHYERDIDDHDRVSLILRREQSRFMVPNELLQQAAGQQQDRNSFESAAQLSYQHIFSPNVLGDFRAMTRDITAGLWSNPFSTPIIAGQDRGYHEVYGKGSLSVHAGIHEFKTGLESDYATVNEALTYLITDPTQFDPGTPNSFSFYGRSPDREQSAFGQDELHWKNLTLSGGLRFDHYDFLVNQTGWSPRAGIAWYWPKAEVVFRAWYDRIFQTPAFENLLVSSSAQVTALSNQFLHLPVQPARGNYYQAGFSRGVFGHLRLDTNFYWRRFHNFPDDNLLLNTGVSFPISFALANVYGIETKLEVPRWGPFSGFLSYANMRGNGYLPVTGGLFLGNDAVQPSVGLFPISQDQRNTVRARVHYDMNTRVWLAAGATYDSGIPTEFSGSYEDALAEYGREIVDRVNFSNGRVRPSFSLNASLGVQILRGEKFPLRFQIDGTNLTDRLNLFDFAGLFSGTAIAPPRSVQARLQLNF
jgi:outer membrane cobalamin receptor